MKKVVLRLDFPNEKIKQKAIKKVSRLTGLESIALDPKDKKLTVIGDIDPVDVVGKLTNVCYTQIVSIGPAEEPKKNEEKKEGGPKEDQSAQLAFPASYYYQHPDFFQQPPVAVALPPYAPPYDHRSVEEGSSGCVIC